MSGRLGWEPDQSKHGQCCGMQGPHSDGRGTKGSCTCGRDALVAELKAHKKVTAAARRVDRKGPNWTYSDMERLGFVSALEALDRFQAGRRRSNSEAAS